MTGPDGVCWYPTVLNFIFASIQVATRIINSYYLIFLCKSHQLKSFPITVRQLHTKLFFNDLRTHAVMLHCCWCRHRSFNHYLVEMIGIGVIISFVSSSYASSSSLSSPSGSTSTCTSLAGYGMMWWVYECCLMTF